MLKLKSVLKFTNILSKESVDYCKGFMNLNLKYNFAKQPKQPKEQKDNKKPAGKQQPKPEVIEDPSEKLSGIQKYSLIFEAATPTLSPSQRQAINNKFEDINQADKELFDILADKILDTNTSVFYDFVLKKGGLGTSQAFYAASSNLTQQQINNSISILRKDI